MVASTGPSRSRLDSAVIDHGVLPRRLISVEVGPELLPRIEDELFEIRLQDSALDTDDSVGGDVADMNVVHG